MTYYKLLLDLSGIETLVQFHDKLKAIFGFPDFYGRNIHALIDCLSSLRHPEDGMSTFTLAHPEDILILEVKGLSQKAGIISNNLLIAIEQVNNRAKARRLQPSVLLNLLKSA